MYNSNYRGFDNVRINTELLTSLQNNEINLKQKRFQPFNKMNFKEEDIEPLDEILSLLMLKNNVSMETLLEEGVLNNDNANGLEIDLINTPNNKFERYLTILKNRNLCKITVTKDGKYARKTDWTYGFLFDGGFKQDFESKTALSKQNVINDFSGSTIGQVNQSSEKMALKGLFKQKIIDKSKKKSWIEILAWIIAIITGLIAIYEFTIKI